MVKDSQGITIFSWVSDQVRRKIFYHGMMLSNLSQVNKRVLSFDRY